MIELATRNLIAGTGHLTWALIIFLEIAFGVVAGNQTARLFATPLPAVSPIPLPFWTQLVALLIVPLAFTVRFNARPRDAGWIIATCALGFGASRLGAALLAWEFSGFLGAFAACAASNFFARYTDRPATVFFAPALLLLVPGSIGFGSVSSFLQKNILSGLEAAFTMVMVAMSIVIGLLAAYAVVPPRRLL